MMRVIEAEYIGQVRLGLVERPHEFEELGSWHYVISDVPGFNHFVAIKYAGISPVGARRQFNYYIERQQAKLASEEDAA